ncbi:MAG: FAD:protein FMN transferase [Clostridiales bacterium]|nr:FAD:protein FMN transferase [Clostridiales bacterium]
MNKKIYVLMIIILLLTACSNFKTNNDNISNNSQPIKKSSFLLDTIVTVQIYDSDDESILNEAIELIKYYELIFSRSNEKSELYRLNHGFLAHEGLNYTISDELADVLSYGIKYGNLSNGYFDITIAPILSLWDFKAENPVLPSDDKLNEAIPLVGYKNMTLVGNNLTFKNQAIEIDLGGIAKGYIADRIKDYLLEKSVESAMINLGGNVLCLGSKPDGSPFNIGIQMPYADRNETIAAMEISDMSVVSSGIYERFITINDKSYHHILNPKTGYPFENNLISVSIISPYSVDGDGLSTTTFALGLEKGMELIESLPDTYAIFITDDYKLHYTKGFEDAINIK